MLLLLLLLTLHSADTSHDRLVAKNEQLAMPSTALAAFNRAISDGPSMTTVDVVNARTTPNRDTNSIDGTVTCYRTHPSVRSFSILGLKPELLPPDTLRTGQPARPSYHHRRRHHHRLVVTSALLHGAPQPSNAIRRRHRFLAITVLNPADFILHLSFPCMSLS